MSSEEEERNSPVLPKDSDQSSSVSSELQQDEYEELLRYAVVTPKLETLSSGHLQQLSTSYLPAEERTSPRKNYTKSQCSADRLHTVPESSRPNSPDPLESTVTAMFISEENIGRMENILDTWSNNLKNVLTELRKWKLAFQEQHKLEMRKERERHAAQTAGLKSELESLKQLVNTYETSTQRKDEVITKLSQMLDRQREKLEKMRAFTHWRLKHAEAKEEAQQYYNLQLKKKVWFAWHSLVQKHWKVKVEQACRARAEEVCTRLSTEYEAKIAEHCEAIEKAQAEVKRLRLERERCEESMKKAFMRGVCALNIEALSMFHNTEDEPGTTTLTQHQPRPISSTQFSPVSGRVITASQQKPAKSVTARITARADIGKTARGNIQVMGVAPPMSSVIVERHHPVTQLTVGQATAAKFPRSSQQGHSSSGGRNTSRTHTTTCRVHSIKVVD
uniref:Centrosomal protein POC5 n=1 Tax=Mola mola TaxID=94237 RepID=A0A3Q3XDT1_MOLML